MTSRSLLTALLTFVLLAPLAAVPGRAGGAGGLAAQVATAGDQAILGGRGIASREVAGAPRGNDWLTAGGDAGELPDGLPQPLSAWLPPITAEVASGDAILPPCGLRAGPRQTTGPPIRS